MRGAPVILFVVIALAGCGGSDGGGGGKRLTRAQYAARADAICKKYTQQTKAIASPSSLEDLANVVDKTLRILQHAEKDLRKLKPPANEQATADQWLAQVNKLEGDLNDIRVRARATDVGGTRSVVLRASKDNKRSNDLATRLGMSVCNSD